MPIPLLILARRQPAGLAAPASGLTNGRYGEGGDAAHRYLSAGLAMAIAAGVGVTLAGALVFPEVARHIDDGISATNIPMPVPPPPPPPDPITDRTPPPDTPLTTPLRDPIFVPPTAPDAKPAQADLPPIPDPGPGPQAETIVDPVPPPPPPVLTDATRDPRFADRFQPAYPPALEREGVAGRARVRVRIGADGRVLAVEDLGASDPAFFAATERQALRYWRFRPATRDGVPVESSQVLTVTFRLPER